MSAVQLRFFAKNLTPLINEAHRSHLNPKTVTPIP